MDRQALEKRDDFLESLVGIEQDCIAGVERGDYSWKRAIHLAIFSVLVQIDGDGEGAYFGGAELRPLQEDGEPLEDIAGNLHHDFARLTR